MYTVYVLKSKIKDWIYVGMTTDIRRRINDHNKGYNKSTKPYKPFILLFEELYDTAQEARKVEKYYKSGVGKEKIRKILTDE